MLALAGDVSVVCTYSCGGDSKRGRVGAEEWRGVERGMRGPPWSANNVRPHGLADVEWTGTGKGSGKVCVSVKVYGVAC